MDHYQSINFISTALDAAMMRQTAIANNIANSSTKNYQTIEVNFEQQLKDSVNDETLSSIKPFYQLSDRLSSIDEQMALSVQNMTHYRALIRGLNQELSIMKLALQGGNP